MFLSHASITISNLTRLPHRQISTIHTSLKATNLTPDNSSDQNIVKFLVINHGHKYQ